jgi:hypothetical protein
MLVLDPKKLVVRATEILQEGGNPFPSWKAKKAVASALGAAFRAGQADGLAAAAPKKRGKKKEEAAP